MDLSPGYKQTEVGAIPQEWDIVRLSDLLDFRNGVNADKRAYGEGTPFINVLEVITHSHIRAVDIPGRVSVSKSAVDSYSVRRGDLVFNRTSETQEEVGLSAVYLDDEPVVFGGFVIRGRPKTDSLAADYSGYALRARSIRSQVIAKGQGAIRANIGQADLRRVLAPRPPLPEQHAIAGALGGVDALLGALTKLIGKKRDLKQAAMQQLLTGRTRLPGFGKPRGKWKPASIGATPQDWNAGSLQSITLKIQDGTHFSPITGGSDFLYVTSRNIGFGRLDVSDAERIDATQHRQIYSRCDVRKGDVLLTKDGANTGNAALNTLDEQFSLLSSVAFLRFDSTKFCPAFFLHQLLSSGGQQRIKGLMSGNAITRLTLQKIRALWVAFPSLPEQSAIAAVLSDMDAELAALEQRLAKTRALKQGMMRELLTGRTRLV